MIRKALTYLTILALTVLPVQLISASVENFNMQMNMSQQAQSNSDCMHEMTDQHVSAEQNSINKTCCDDQSHECQSCGNCPQAVTTMILPLHMKVKTSLLKSSKLSIRHLALYGVSQKNLLRPPRNFI